LKKLLLKVLKKNPIFNLECRHEKLKKLVETKEEFLKE